MSKIVKQLEKLGLKHLAARSEQTKTNKAKLARTKLLDSLVTKPSSESFTSFSDIQHLDSNGDQVAQDDINAFSLNGNSIDVTLTDKSFSTLIKSISSSENDSD